jgi:PIN domain nuclease of toxin-antitoxin system
LSPKIKPQVRCWDANCILGWLSDEADKVPKLKPIIEAAEGGDGSVTLLSSALALVEVIWLKPYPKLGRETEKLIQDFFKHSWIMIVDIDRKTAELARQLVWEYNVKPKDSVYVATALLRSADCLDTFDGELIALSGKIALPGKSTPLTIAEPYLPEQMKLFSKEQVAATTESSESEVGEEPPDEPDI